jgi:CubicO group peptidase (beta-lactamase class C family)
MKKAYLFSLFSLLVLSVAFVTNCNGQSNSNAENGNAKPIDQTKAEKINDLISTYAEYGKFNGAVLVAEKGKVIYKKAFGLANMEWDIPNQTDTKFRLASVTKQFTAMLIMQLVAENKLALDVPISTYLPEYPKENGEKINIHHLLTHTSGIPNYTSFANYRDIIRNSIKPAEIVSTFADSTLQFTPGERFSYSNSGYALLGVLIEEVTGKSFEKVLQEKILIPLKMDNTGFENYRTVLKNRATGYNNNGGTFTNSGFIDMSVAFTAGGMFSTVEDLFLWDQTLYTTTLLPKKYMDIVFNKHTPAWGEHYGYGWLIGEMSIGNTKEKIKTINHDGVINGFTALILRMPSDQSSILFLNNTGGAPLYEMSKAINGILYDKHYDLPKKSIAHSLLKVIDKEGITKGVQYYNSIKEDSAHYLNEEEMNMVSYQLLQSDRGKAAAAVLQLGIASFPNAFNLYDSYGEVLTALGKKEEAIKNYKKSLALNPQNENGIQMLKKLGVDIDREDLYLVKKDKSWSTEIFTFPLNFAQDLKYQGTEEAHFPKGWRKPDSPEFWSYVFAWNIDLATELTETKLENNLQSYFDGLAKVVNKNKDLIPPNSIAKFHKEEAANAISKFTGTIDIFDAFVTQEKMTLNVLVEKHYCAQKQKSIILFKFSPKAFGHEIWGTLEKMKLRDNMCEN